MIIQQVELSGREVGPKLIVSTEVCPPETKIKNHYYCYQVILTLDLFCSGQNLYTTYLPCDNNGSAT